MESANLDLKQRLQQELDETLAEIARLDERLEGKGDYGLGKGDPGIYEWEMCLALKQRAQSKARSLEVALQKADEGGYGICEVCQQPIDPARLAIVPETRRCINCAQKR
ncbi:MAG TPA: TraR/DksA C4-type zinc finger protein [Anaerolineae bacterium]|nr:TraR/DksA C4-type zinc finger protein [Anaerolineae bacterium]